MKLCSAIVPGPFPFFPSTPNRKKGNGLLICMLACGAVGPAFADTVNRIVAVVNEDVVTEADVDASLDLWLEEQDPQPPAGDPARLRDAVLRRLIEQRVILQEARRQGIQVGEDDIDQRLVEIRRRFESEEAFQRSLAESRLPMERLKEQLRDQLMVQRLIDTKVRATITVSPLEVAKALDAHPELARPGDRVRASHILVRASGRQSAEQARALITSLHQQAAQGADFADLARRHSEDPQASAGGVLGWVAPGELLPELDRALFELQEGQVSPPIETSLGFHLVKLEERRAADRLSVADANHAVHQQLYQQKFQDAFSRWLAGLLERAYIEVLAPQPDAG